MTTLNLLRGRFARSANANAAANATNSAQIFTPWFETAGVTLGMLMKATFVVDDARVDGFEDLKRAVAGAAAGGVRRARLQMRPREFARDRSVFCRKLCDTVIRCVNSE